MVALIDGRRIRIDSDVPIDARVRAIAAHQRARLRRGQLMACGITAATIKRRLRSARLTRVHYGVYALPDTEDVPLAPEAAAVLACGEGAVLSHHSAVTLWALRAGVARPVHVTIPGERGCPRPSGVIVHRSRTLAPADIRVHEGLPVTSPARALLDASGTLPDRDVERLLDEALFAQRIVRQTEIEDVLTRAGNHPGRARLERVASRHTRSTKTDSPPEETMFRLIRAAGLPDPVTQAPVLGYRLDFFWPDLRLAVEVDAYGTHGSRARFEADRRRDARLLTEKGIVVIRLTRATIEARPLEVVALLARAVGQRETELRAT
jgi:very-short-patch-repair endonuclease